MCAGLDEPHPSFFFNAVRADADEPHVVRADVDESHQPRNCVYMTQMLMNLMNR